MADLLDKQIETYIFLGFQLNTHFFFMCQTKNNTR